MHATLQTAKGTTIEIGDMNGPLCYWGPVEGHTVSGVSPKAALTRTDLDALRQLGRTVNGRTWAGTNALMSALFAGAPEMVAA